MTEPTRKPGDREGDSSSLPMRAARLLIGIGLSVLFLYLTFRHVDLGRIAGELDDVYWAALPLSIAIEALAFGAMTARSKLFFDRIGEYGTWRLYKSVLLAHVANNLLPFRAGEVGRIGYLAHRDTDASSGACLAAVAVERLLDLLVLSVGFLVLLTLALVDTSVRGVPTLPLALALTAGVGASLTLVVSIARCPDRFVRLAEWTAAWVGGRASDVVGEQARRVTDGLSAVGSPIRVTAAVAATVGYWASGALFFEVWLRAMGTSLPLAAPFAVTALTAIGTMLPSTPAFLGTYHYFAKISLQMFGVAASTAATFALIAHGAAFVPTTVIGILVLAGDDIVGVRM